MKLLVQKDFGGPILTVTQTNHAVDSLLEGCLDANVATKPGEIIRIGGRSKSERLTPYNLREVSGLVAHRWQLTHDPIVGCWLQLDGNLLEQVQSRDVCFEAKHWQQASL